MQVTAKPWKSFASTRLMVCTLILVFVLPSGCSFSEKQPSYTVSTAAEGLEHPWGLAFLPDGRALVTERAGRLRLVSLDTGKVSTPLKGVPEVWAFGQGGLLDVAISPSFVTDNLVYLSYSEPGDNNTASTAVMRGELFGDEIKNPKVIFRQVPKVQSGVHFGSRLVFGPDGKLFVALGERGQKALSQDLRTHYGKVVRISSDGTVPSDNPFVNDPGVKPEIWSYGHRNQQGAAINPDTGLLWTCEHGAQGGDEINIPGRGKNYGWPVITWGIDYDGSKIGEGTAKDGMEQPLYYWNPSIAPSGMTFYTGSKLEKWKGSLFIGSLKFGYLARLTLRGSEIVSEERLLTEVKERIRAVVQGPDDLLYVLTDSSNGRVLRISPAEK